MANNSGARPPVRQIQSGSWQRAAGSARQTPQQLAHVQGGQAIHYTGPPAPPATWAPPSAPPTTPPAGAPPNGGAATPPAPPDLSGSKWMGYLTPDQLQALNAASTTYGINVGAEERRSGIQVDANGQPIKDASGGYATTQGDAEIQYNQAVQAAQQAHDMQQAQANEQLAARGLFQSSIRDNDLADIDTAMVQRQVSARAALNSLVADAADAIGRLNAGWAGTQSQYMGFAATNAANAPPPIAPPAPPAPPANNTPAAPAAPAAPPIMQQIAAAHPTWFPPYATPPKPAKPSGPKTIQSGSWKAVPQRPGARTPRR